LIARPCISYTHLGGNMKTKSVTKPLSLAAMVTAGALALSACGDTETADTGNDGDKGTISIVAVPGWTDQTGTAYIYQHVLEENGYDVEVETLGDMAPAFTAVAQGDIDLFGSTWPDRTQDVYWEEHKDTLEDLGTYYDEAKLFLAVPEYSDIESIEDLPNHADEQLGLVIVGPQIFQGILMLFPVNILRTIWPGRTEKVNIALSYRGECRRHISKSFDFYVVAIFFQDVLVNIGGASLVGPTWDGDDRNCSFITIVTGVCCFGIATG